MPDVGSSSFEQSHRLYNRKTAKIVAHPNTDGGNCFRENFGFDTYRVTRRSINRFVHQQVLQSCYSQHPGHRKKGLFRLCQHLGIHWYRPGKLTQGLRGAYLRSQMATALFFAKFNEKTDTQNINVSFQDHTPLPFDEAA